MLRTAMTLSDPASGRMLTITTSEPGLQVYTGNFLDGTFRGHSSRPYMYRSGLAFEPQHFPDSPNRPAFPTTELAPGKKFHSVTRYGFKLTR
jgi:aldose 1-epimerase